MSTILLISFVVGLAYIVGIVLTFRRAARELESTNWLLTVSAFWPLAWAIFGIMYLWVMAEEAHIRIGKAWRS